MKQLNWLCRFQFEPSDTTVKSRTPASTLPYTPCANSLPFEAIFWFSTWRFLRLPGHFLVPCRCMYRPIQLGTYRSMISRSLIAAVGGEFMKQLSQLYRRLPARRDSPARAFLCFVCLSYYETPHVTRIQIPNVLITPVWCFRSCSGASRTR